jgi:hypothetical protein
VHLVGKLEIGWSLERLRDDAQAREEEERSTDASRRRESWRFMAMMMITTTVRFVRRC